MYMYGMQKWKMAHFSDIFLFLVVDHKGEVQKDLHNNDLEFIKFKFFYNDDEECKFNWTLYSFINVLKYYIDGFKSL